MSIGLTLHLPQAVMYVGLTINGLKNLKEKKKKKTMHKITMKSIEKPQHIPGNLEFCIHM